MAKHSTSIFLFWYRMSQSRLWITEKRAALSDCFAKLCLSWNFCCLLTLQRHNQNWVWLPNTQPELTQQSELWIGNFWDEMIKLLHLPAKLQTVVRDWDKLVETKTSWESWPNTCLYLWFLILPLAFTATATVWFLSINASTNPCKMNLLSYLHRQAWHGKTVVANKQTNK